MGSEWVYAGYAQIRGAVDDVSQSYGGKLEEFNLDGIENQYKANLKHKHRYEAKIVYFV